MRIAHSELRARRQMVLAHWFRLFERNESALTLYSKKSGVEERTHEVYLDCLERDRLKKQQLQQVRRTVIHVLFPFY